MTRKEFIIILVITSTYFGGLLFSLGNVRHGKYMDTQELSCSLAGDVITCE